MDAVSDRAITQVVVMSAAQVGKSEVILNVLGYHVDQEPAPILVIQPTLEMAQTFSKDRLAPMIRDTPALRGVIKDPRARDSGNTLLKKDYPGGHITLCGANSPASLAMRPVRVVLCDEVDRYPASAGSEGDPVNLAIKRAATFWNRTIVLVSTPTEVGLSRIERAYDASDQRRFHVPCPHCGHKQVLIWSQVKWEKDGKEHKPETAYYECEECEGRIEEHQKLAMVSAGEWIAKHPERKIAGFHLSELCSTWRSWAEIVTDFLESKGNQETLKTWTNTSLGETFEVESKQADPGALYRRREFYESDTPDAVLAITAGVDVQDDRLELYVWGWGLGEECWLLDHVQRWGDPGRTGVWKSIAQDLMKTYDGIPIAAAAVDTGGHYTQQAYTFCKSHSRAFAIKGMDGEGRPIIGRPGKASAAKVPLWTVGVDTCKELLLSRLSVTDPGPGYIHLPVTDWCDEELCEQLTAEKAVRKYKNGRPLRVWVKTRPRNEASDCWNYGYAALCKLRPNFEMLHSAKEVQSLQDKGEIPKPPPPSQIQRSGRFQRRGL